MVVSGRVDILEIAVEGSRNEQPTGYVRFMTNMKRIPYFTVNMHHGHGPFCAEYSEALCRLMGHFRPFWVRLLREVASHWEIMAKKA